MDNYTVFDQVTDAIKGQLHDGRTQKELARELHINQCTVSSIISGRRRLGRRTFEKILRVNPPWLKGIING